MRKLIVTIMGVCALVALVISCAATDVVAMVAKTSFAAVVAASGPRVSYSGEDASWVLESPEGDELLISTDFARNAGSGGMADMDKPDAEMTFDAAPFLAAGLDMSHLIAPEGIKYQIEDGRFMLHVELGQDLFGMDAKKSMDAVFAELLRTHRSAVGYHEKLDHYGVKLGGGNMFEWAKDMARNDKDIVWVLNPEPLTAAGVDPAKLTGWVYAKVEMKDDAGKTIFVDKFLKPFGL